MDFRYKKFTGGILDTNAYLVDAPGGAILFDAPQDVCGWLESMQVAPRLLLLTHGHFDHVTEAAEVRKRFGSVVGIHRADRPMVAEAGFFEKMGFALPVALVEVDRDLDEGAGQDFLGIAYDVFHVPGHSPGSLCFLDRAANVLIGGDVLFAGGIGRADLPGGDAELLLSGIRDKILTLTEEIVVLPGHGPQTWIGRERVSNPFLV